MIPDSKQQVFILNSNNSLNVLLFWRLCRGVYCEGLVECVCVRILLCSPARIHVSCPSVSPEPSPARPLPRCAPPSLRQTACLPVRSVWLCLSHAGTRGAADPPRGVTPTASRPPRQRSEVTRPHSRRLGMAPGLPQCEGMGWMNPFYSRGKHVLCLISMSH